MEREMWGGVLLPWNIFLPFDRTSTKKRMVHINSKIPCSRRLKINWQRRRRGLDAYQRRRRSTRCWSSGRVPICTWWCAWARSGTRSGTDYASTLPWSTARPSIGSWNGRGKPSSKLATSSSWISIWRSLSPAKLNRLVLGAQPLLLFPLLPADRSHSIPISLESNARHSSYSRKQGEGGEEGGENRIHVLSISWNPIIFLSTARPRPLLLRLASFLPECNRPRAFPATRRLIFSNLPRSRIVLPL